MLHQVQEVEMEVWRRHRHLGLKSYIRFVSVSAEVAKWLGTIGHSLWRSQGFKVQYNKDYEPFMCKPSALQAAT